MSDQQVLAINGQVTVTKGIRHDGMWSVLCVYYSNTGRGKFTCVYIDAELAVAVNEFNSHWIQSVVDFEAGM